MPEINLRAELVKWFKKRAHWVVVRLQTTKLSGIVDTETGQVTVLGSGTTSGRPYTDVLVKSDRRKVVPDIEISLPPGNVEVGVDHFYFEHYLPIRKNDLIMEIETDDAGDPVLPIKIRAIYKVTDPQDMRDGAGITPGRVEFFQCSVKEVNAG